ncbi:uncharacterized protein B0P05DRAFT_504148 [Gilbertella persicaria]|uniref:uncharacterized protein n=1 Tax=Gilbertella persicaria TaxID=101096 RepID=UPI00221F565E|nr:uncharacterized protein B0P05DRAFT_504148 [Gilbertella persicaria]KAI8091404.1 hypothetical protein B0P05DRAFT_504148 [Gilbertella persicaria]
MISTRDVLLQSLIRTYTTTSNPSALFKSAIERGSLQQARSAYGLLDHQHRMDRHSLRKLVMMARHSKDDFINTILADMKQTWKLKPTHFEYHALMYAYGIQRQPEKSYAVLDRMRHEQGLQPTLYSYNTLLGCFKRTHDLERAQALLKEMKQHKIQPDIVTFNTMLHLLSIKGEYQQAFDMYHAMTEQGVDPDLYTFSTVLDMAVKSGHITIGQEVYHQLLGQQIDIHTTNNMIRFISTVDFNKALDLYHTLEPNKVDIVTFNILLDLCLKHQNSSKAYMIFQEMKKANVKPDIVTYGTLIDAESKQGNLKSAIQLFRDMRAVPIEPNARILNSLVNMGASKQASVTELEQLVDIASEHKGWLDTKAYNALMYGLALKGKSGQVQRVYDTVFRGRTKQPDIATFTHLILSYMNNNQLQDAMEIYYTLREHDKKCRHDNHVNLPIQLDATFYSTLISALSDASNADHLDAALTLFHDMRPLQIQPSIHTYTAMLHACGQHRNPYVLDQIHQFIKVDLYLDPDIGIYNALMDAYNRVGDGDRVLEIWQTLCMPALQSSDLGPDQVSVSIVFDSCGHNGQAHKAPLIWTWLKKRKFRLNTNNYNSYIECLCRQKGREGWDTAYDLVKQEMTSRPMAGKVLMDKKTVNTLISFAKKKGFNQTEIQALEQMA